MSAFLIFSTAIVLFDSREAGESKYFTKTLSYTTWHN